ncbi:hypothetical protein BTTOUR_35560 [Bacillus thuringiensis serovar toumanoffi]|uniref:Uncharacterized protein n=1 Tax=Bacillus thuringiensis serovar toumanoffi TaxID=180862 RepID=A0ABD5IB84_BACTU|nr:hypothetical protein [Bacillus thuringiensis serovar toumanoffi]
MKYVLESAKKLWWKCRTVYLMILCFWLIMFLVAGEHFFEVL